MVTMAQIGIQLYTVRDALENDYVGTLRQISKIGYEAIEFGGIGPLSVEDFKALLKELKLNPISAHTGWKALGRKREDTLSFYESIGVRFLALSDRRDSAKGWKEAGQKLTAVGRAAQAHGITFQYHDHAHEFQKHNGKTGLDILLDASDPELVPIQLDVGWVQRAGEDPVAWLHKLKGRIRTIHMKDTTSAPDPVWTEVGTGVLPLKAVHQAAQAIGVEWYLVEQDTCARPTLESAAISYDNLKKVTG